MNSRGRIKVLVWITAAIITFTGSGVSQTSKSRTTAKSPLNQARSELARHDLKSAEASVWKVLTSDPNNAEGLLLLGVIRDEQQRYPEAEAVLQRAAQLDPKLAAVHVYLGKTYLSENKLPESLEEYKQAEELAPNDVEVRVTLARLYAASGDFASALTALKA